MTGRTLPSAAGSKLLAHVETWRLYTSTYVGLLSLAAAALWSRGLPPAPVAVLAFLVPAAGWLAGLYGCDYFDRDLDRVQKAHRPIPSGRMRPREAFVGMLVCMYLGFLGAARLGFGDLLLAGAAMIATVAYSFGKGLALLGNVFRALPAAVTVLFGAVAVGAPALPDAWLPILLFFLHDMSTNLVGTIRDVEGDGAAGCRTVPVRYGLPAAVRLTTALVAAWAVLACLLPFLLPVQRGAYALFAVPALALAGAALTLVWRRPDDRPLALLAHKLLVIERLLLAAAVLASAAGPLAAAAVVLPLVALAQLTQMTLRDRHELGPAAAPAAEGSGDAGALDGATLEGVVEELLARLATDDRARAAVRGWNRRGEVRIEDVDLSAHFEARDGAVERVDRARFDASSAGTVRIRTSAAVFTAVFVRRTMPPATAYLRRGVQLDCSPLDMVRISRLFAVLLDAAAPAGGPAIVPVASDEPAPAAARPFVIADTTLRDGEQMPGIRFTPAQKLALARALDGAHVPLLEVGYPAVSESEREAIRAIVAAGLEATIQVISRPLPAEIDLAADLGPDSIALFVGTSRLHLEHKLRMSWDELLRVVEAGVRHAARRNVQVVFSPEDATRTDRDRLLEVCGVAIGAGAQVIGLADTVGVMTPDRMAELVAWLAPALGVPLAVHCHDDLGLATANSLAALGAGAAGAQCSLGGIGERGGNAPLEEVAVAAQVLLGHRVGIDLAALGAAAELLFAFLPFGCPPNKAVIGANAFTHESGLHVDGVLGSPATYEPYEPALVGQRRRFVFGKHSGRAAVAAALTRAERPADPDLVARVTKRVKALGEAGTTLLDEDVVRLSVELELAPAADD